MNPTCPHHPSIRMRLVSSAEPLYAQSRRASARYQTHIKQKNDERLIYRCAVTGCPRVEPKPREPEKYFCRIKGCKKEVCPNRWAVSDYICREHHLLRNEMRRKCPRGHGIQGANVYVYQGRRTCRKCRALAARKWVRRNIA